MAPDRGRFVFVNQLGHKAEDLASEQLAALLREESVRLLDERDATTIERAWRRMLEGLHNQLAEQATHDALTGLLNRTEFDRRLAAALSNPQRESMALLWIGVDHLRMLNENHGMAAGDAALIAVAQNLRRFVEQRQAQAARIAGDEFVLLLGDIGEDTAAGIARTLCREIAEREPQW
ncbi:MAG: diguanylate cyclase, partial [Xanthomonadales bacterium]|nr:diguanylate cyclase [Xanthomonadales bacterium]